MNIPGLISQLIGIKTLRLTDVSSIDKNVFLFSFNHEVDVLWVWERRPWSFKGEHLILKKYDPEWSLNEVDFSTTDFWVQSHGLPLNRQFDSSVRKIRRMIGEVLDVDLIGSGVGSCKRFVRVRVRLDVHRPLPMGFPLDRKPIHPLWIQFKFEKLGLFCYGCGMLGHDIKDCVDVEVQKLWRERVMLGIHRSWLRSEVSEFQPGIDLDELENSYHFECIRPDEAGPSIPKTQTQSPWIIAV